MNKAVIGIIALLILVGAAVYATRGVINRNLSRVAPRINIKPGTNVSPVPTTTKGSPLLIVATSPLPGVAGQPLRASGLPQASPSQAFPAPSSGLLPATGM